VVEHLLVVAAVALEQQVEVEARDRRQVEVLPQPVGRARLLLQAGDQLGARLARQQQQRLLDRKSVV
jgi:hypothetical protein